MRIVYLCADRGIPVWGSKGASIHVRSVARSLRDRGHEVELLAMRTGEAPVARFDVPTLEVPFDRTLKSLRTSIQAASDTTQSSEIYSLLLNSSVQESLLSLEHESPVEAIYERYSLWSVAGLRFARARRIPYLLEVNAPLVHEQEQYRQLRLKDAAKGIERLLFTEADAVFVPSEELKEYIVSRIGVRRRLYVTPNGVDLSRFSGRSRARLRRASPKPDRFNIAFVGSLKPWHGIDILLSAFETVRKTVPGARLLIVGDGPARSEVDELQSRLGEEVVLTTGAVPHDDIPAWLAQADVGVAPYPDLDSFYFSPLKVVEYMAAGLPTVASSVGQLRTLVKQGSTGLLVPAGDVGVLAAALTRLAEDRRLRLDLGRNARDRAERLHGWDRVTDRIEKVLNQMTGQSLPRGAEAEQLEAVAGDFL